MQEVESYKVQSDMIEITVKIMRTVGRNLRYELVIPELSVATAALLDEIRNQLVVETTISTSEILNPQIIDALKQRFSVRADALLDKLLPNLEPDVKTYLVNTLLHEMLGLGDVEFLMNDSNLEEIVLTSSKEPIRVFHKKYGWLDTNIFVRTEDQIHNYASIIARRVGRQVTTLNPLLDAHLVTGDRANAVLYPIATKGNTITIRKFARDPWTVTDFIKNNTCDSSVFALVWLAVQYEMNILVSGGTASGKTSMLNVLMAFIPPNQRILSIEDTRELQLAEHLYWCPLITRQPNPEGKGKVSMFDLLVNSLRMRPDRIILGEMRKKDQAEVLFEAMHTGHSVYATVHADTIADTIRRLTNPPLKVPPNLLSAVNLDIVMFRDRRKGIRRTFQIGEFITSEEEEGRTSVKPNILYRWRPDSDKIVVHGKAQKLFEDLSRHTGMSQKEIDKDLATKKFILDWMVKNNFRSIDQVGKIMNAYYVDPESFLKIVEKGNVDELFK
ncbi:MAG: ATPase, T2SS/T4P/T4SS family [Candidatus Nanoarchaeia archaeon]